MVTIGHIGQRIWTSPSEKARTLGFQSKQLAYSLGSAFFLSAMDAYFATSLPQEIANWLYAKGRSFEDYAAWRQFYWSAELEPFLKLLTDDETNAFFTNGSAVLITNNTVTQLPAAGGARAQACAVGVARSGTHYFALYRSDMQAEIVPLPCGHSTSSEAIYEKCPQTAEFKQEHLEKDCKLPCGCAMQVETLLLILNRRTPGVFVQPQAPIPTPMVIDAALTLHGTCHIPESKIIEACEYIQQTLQCPTCPSKIGPDEYLLVCGIYNSLGGNANQQEFCFSHLKECVPAKHSHEHCKWCQECWMYMMQQLTPSQQNPYPQPINCLSCCKPVALDAQHQLVHVTNPNPKNPPNPFMQCSACGQAKECFQLIACDHLICNDCAILVYKSEAMACGCGKALDVNDCCTISLLTPEFEFGHKDLRVPRLTEVYCRNHGTDTKVQGFVRYSENSNHRYCFPCDNCLFQQFSQAPCVICYRPLIKEDFAVLQYLRSATR